MMDKIARFMMGRYGNDTLNNHLLILVIILIVSNIFLQNPFIQVFEIMLWGYVIFRMLSRQVYKRNAENEAYLNLFKPINRKMNLIKKNAQDKDNKYFRCPSCKQMVRVPKGKGKVEITCPKCRTRFDKRT
ncbi:MAG: zinc-ribbon domain-containing protein [Erysipelotrichales bacterium]|nr:zinc-ribbon domain-containing protein [Erysipelotrichales bacterium]